MQLDQTIKKATMILTLITSLVACSSKPEIKEFPKSADAKQEITNLELAMENSRSEEYDLLAPVSYGKANESLKEAKALLKDDKSDEKVLKEVALGRAYLERAQKNSEESRGKTLDILTARESAIKANADTLLPREFQKLDKHLKIETASIEEDDDDELKAKRSDLIAGYRDVELGAVKKQYLGESRALIDEAVKNGARDLTPKTLSVTNAQYEKADLFVTQNRNNIPEIEAIAATTLVEARKLSETTNMARGLSSKTPEDTALRMQAQQGRLSETESALMNQKGTTEALAAKNSALAKDQKLNAVYDEARKKFSPEEAEVYKQGSNLVIRLRSLEFPQAQAVLKGDDFALLKKVEDVIVSFDKSAVIVEGHTDSTGGQKLNQQLSEDRASAVKKYLEANTAEHVTEFESKGFGYEKPLSSNKSASGRAQNRRVDVVIEPVQI